MPTLIRLLLISRVFLDSQVAISGLNKKLLKVTKMLFGDYLMIYGFGNTIRSVRTIQ